MRIFVVDHDGREHALRAEPGWRIMEIIRDWGVPIKAECGGACACATCHVYVDPEWVDRLRPPSDEENDRLDEALVVRSDSRLSCQILMAPDLDGLRVRLAPGSEIEKSKRYEPAR
ncbi:MAG TPA: 2Fe-2S iron-sulfur cluster-binding protein [Xanthobacteraceae bacterium]|nr:2Fe-2S iron-sulfur cluster-binding protein [Xanthobacteraceae bacterium]